MSKAKRVTKEDIYDAKIFPLMSQIIDICKQHKIAMIADFAVPNKSDPKLKCTTCLLDESHEPGDEQLEAMRALLHVNAIRR